MIDIVLQYGLFLAQAITIVLAIVLTIGAVALIVTMAAKQGNAPENLQIQHLNDRFRSVERAMRRAICPKDEFKAYTRELKRAAKADKARGKGAAAPRRVFVLGFKGDMRASAVRSLREEVSAVLTLAGPGDEVVLRLENAGGVVHDHGLAASQLMRLRERGIRLTAAVDKVAASGGYMMACVADRITAAPFAVLGSIGVLLQLPNFHRALDAHGVGFEQIKGGEFKRTLSVFGENTEADRAKAREDVEAVHELFKGFVAEHRPGLDLARVATGEHWYGLRAKELNLCDELTTSDDLLRELGRECELYEIRYRTRKRLGGRLSEMLERLATRLAGAARVAAPIW